jgi:hypothetical protein
LLYSSSNSSPSQRFRLSPLPSTPRAPRVWYDGQMTRCKVCLSEGCSEYIHSPSTIRFAEWIHGRCTFYADLKLLYYMDGEPYFASQGAEVSLSDYLRREAELTAPKQLSLL